MLYGCFCSPFPCGIPRRASKLLLPQTGLLDALCFKVKSNCYQIWQLWLLLLMSQARADTRYFPAGFEEHCHVGGMDMGDIDRNGIGVGVSVDVGVDTLHGY